MGALERRAAPCLHGGITYLGKGHAQEKVLVVLGAVHTGVRAILDGGSGQVGCCHGNGRRRAQKRAGGNQLAGDHLGSNSTGQDQKCVWTGWVFGEAAPGEPPPPQGGGCDLLFCTPLHSVVPMPLAVPKPEPGQSAWNSLCVLGGTHLYTWGKFGPFGLWGSAASGDLGGGTALVLRRSDRGSPGEEPPDDR